MTRIFQTRSIDDQSGRDHRPLNDHTVEGDDIDELIDFMIHRIIPKSRTFYGRELRIDLNAEGKSVVDVYAGMGMHYDVVLVEKNNQLPLF